MLGQPWKGYYLTAYGIAVKHGFVGTEEEWLASLNGEPGAGALLRYNEEAKAIEWKPEGSGEWTAIVPLSVIQGELVAATLKDAEDAAEKAAEAEEKILSHIKEYGTIVQSAYVLGDTLDIGTSDGKVYEAGNVRGGKGDTGNSGVYIGTEEPTDPEVKVWIDPTGHDGMRELINILSKLKYTNGGVTVDLSDYATMGDLEGKAPSTHKHSASDITSGTLPVARGGHGGTSVVKAQENLGLACVKTGGTGAAYTATIPGITELKTGVKVRIEPHTSCTTPYPTLNVNGLGDADIYMKLAGGGCGETANVAGWLEAHHSYELTYSECDEGWIANVTYIDLDGANTFINALPVKHGGTGRESFPAGQFLVGSSSGGIVTKTPAQALSALGKLTGSYTGNGSATARTIETGGTGNCILIWRDNGTACIGTPKLAICGTGIIDSSEFKFVNGTLTITSIDYALNANGETYNYQVL